MDVGHCLLPEGKQIGTPTSHAPTTINIGNKPEKNTKSSIPAPYDTGSMSNNLNHLTQVNQIQA